MQSKREELTRWEAGLQSKQQQVSSMESECQRLSGELRGEREKAERLQGLLHDTTSKLVILQQQKDALQQKVDQVSNMYHPPETHNTTSCSQVGRIVRLGLTDWG